jgi:sarcosine oxidase subunit gamma
MADCTDIHLRGAWGAFRSLPVARRWVLHSDPKDAVSLQWPGGLPTRMLRSTMAASPNGQAAAAALRLGPDEWLLLALDGAVIPPAAEGLVSVVDVSHRNLAFEIGGPCAATLINAGNPLDLSDGAFPPGKATRSVLGKAEVVLWRPTAAPRWHVEVWRSFAPYLVRLVSRAIDDL